jgi:hypothetical protein
MTENPDDTPYVPGGLPGAPEGGETSLRGNLGPVVTESARRHLLEAFHGFGEGSGPPPGWRGPSADLVIVDEWPPVAPKEDPA